METTPRHSCLKLQIPNSTEPIFVKGTWYQTHFNLSITDGLDAWLCNAAEEEVRERAAQWDQPVTEYVNLAERYLGFQQPGSVYGFNDASNGYKRLSWTFEKEGTKLEWRWKCEPAPNSKSVTAGILDFLMDANIRLSWKAEKSLAQSERLNKEKVEFESAIYTKFLGVLNSKKAKLRELRDQLSKRDVRNLREEEESTDETEIFDEVSDDERSEEEAAKDITSTSKGAPANRACGRKRTTRK
ncbi:hypothetical protein Patl1_25219 [Pistacia atlantica]|uniref:Uncharacterized protein n=1 Tax=Pistacia atlantica TaxID=434234 RepID=A0ACC1B214_9ROSI|nr:hypothetical protein Patl1_25219 [Pistacia atlantica]